MPTKLQSMRMLSESALTEITQTNDAWLDYLDTAAWLYKYPFHDQLLVYAQRPDARACAPIELWNNTFRRWVNRGAKGIALIDDSSDRPRLKYVFDVSDTNSRDNIPFRLWELRPDWQQEIIGELSNRFGEIENKPDFAESLLAVVQNAVLDNIADYLEELPNLIDGSELSGLSDDELADKFINTVYGSVAYAVLTRSGVNPRQVLTLSNFLYVPYFDTPATIAHLGSTTADLSETILREIERSARSLARQERDILAKQAQSEQNRIEESERSSEHGTDIQTGRGLSDPEPRTGRESDGELRQIREIAEKLLTETAERLIQQYASDGELDAAPHGDRADGAEPHFRDASQADEAERRDGAAESERSDGVGAEDEQSESTDRGNDSDGAGVQLNDPIQLSLFPSEEEQRANIGRAESVAYTPFAFSFTQDEIDHVLRLGSNTDFHRMEIVAEFSKQKSLEENTAFVKRLFHGGNGFRIGKRAVTAWYANDGIHLSEGSTARYTTAAQIISWQDVTKRIGELLEQGQYANNVELAEAFGHERYQIAYSLLLMTHDLSEEAKEIGYFGNLEPYLDLMFPAGPQQLAIALQDRAFLQHLLYEYAVFGIAHDTNRDLLRFNFYKPLELWLRLQDLTLSRKAYTSDMIQVPEAERFITDDEIDTALSEKHAATAIQAYFRESHTTAEKAEYLRERYGQAGRSHALSDASHSDESAGSKGIQYQKEGCPNVLLNWNAVVKRVSELIRKGRYAQEREAPPRLTAEELDEALMQMQDAVGELQKQEPITEEHPVAIYPAEENNLPFDVEVRVLRTEEPAQEQPQSLPPEKHDFRITDDKLGHGGAKLKFRRNLDAINTLRVIEEEHRLATPDEQEVLSQYVGWGGLPQAFDAENPAWSEEYEDLAATLSPDEYAAARASTLNAHYTSPTVIKAIYKCVENMGFRTGNVLEPSCGIGNFFGLLPESMSGSKLYGVELDPITGRIAKQLYQTANIAIQGFEETNLPDSFFDLAIGNVPFGDYGVADKRYDKNHFLIHDYFFAKTLDKVRPGGVIAFVTSSGTMDKKNASVRKYIAERAELLGAVRLPNNAFLANAGTGVVADILFLQKRDRPIAVEPDWVHLGKTEQGFPINQYFVDHPDMVLGELTEESTQYGHQACTVKPIAGAELSDQLADAIANIHGDFTEFARDPELEASADTSIPSDPTVRNFSFALVDGDLYYRENSRMNKVEVSMTAESRIKGMIGIRECTRKLIAYQLEGYPDESIAQVQAELNRLYDDFTTKYGLINSRGNSMAFSDDSSYCLLCSLEVLNENGGLERKADMFTKRTIRQQQEIDHVDTAAEALAVSIGERARIDLAYMSKLTGKTEEDLETELSGVVFRDLGSIQPDGMAWAFFDDRSFPLVPADEFLSGNVRDKLKRVSAVYEIIRSHSNDTELVNRLRCSVEALQKVQPKDLAASEIDVRLGATWLPVDDIRAFMEELLKPSYWAKTKIKVFFSEYTAEWRISNKTSDYDNVTANVTYGTTRINGYKIIEESLNLKDVRIFDTVTDEYGNEKRVLNKKETVLAQQKQQAIKDAFRDWIWRDPDRRERLTRLYNEKFNSIRPREYDGSHIRFVGMNPEITLRPHQVNAIARTLYGGNTLLAHVVGAGKSATRS